MFLVTLQLRKRLELESPGVDYVKGNANHDCLTNSRLFFIDCPLSSKHHHGTLSPVFLRETDTASCVARPRELPPSTGFCTSFQMHQNHLPVWPRACRVTTPGVNQQSQISRTNKFDTTNTPPASRSNRTYSILSPPYATHIPLLLA